MLATSPYLINLNSRMLFVKFISYRTRSRSCTTDCEGECPVLQVTVLSGDRADGNCRHRTYVNPGTYRKPSGVSVIS